MLHNVIHATDPSLISRTFCLKFPNVHNTSARLQSKIVNQGLKPAHIFSHNKFKNIRNELHDASRSTRITTTMEILNCFGDIETVDSDTSRDNDQDLIVIGDKLITNDQLDDCQVKTIHLVGSFIAGCHQELRFFLQQQQNKKENCSNSDQKTRKAFLIRISRVNGTDTFQVVEDNENIAQGGRGGKTSCLDDLPTLMELDTFPKITTLHDVKTAFDKARNLMKRYDQGDCHALSQMICDLLVPGSFPAELDW